MNKQILQVKQKFKDNVYKTRTCNIPFENILFYQEKTTDDDIEYVVIVKEYGAIDVSKEEYDEVVKYFNPQEKEPESSIESTAFKIIKEKGVDVSLVIQLAKCHNGYAAYNNHLTSYKGVGDLVNQHRKSLTKDEFDTLVHALKK